MLNELFVKVVTLSLSAALIAVLVTGLRLILRKAPKAWVCALWALVAVRLLIPSLPESRVSVVPQQVSKGTVVREISARPVEDTVKVREYEPGYAEIVSRQPMLPVQRESVRVEANADEAEKWQSAVPAGEALNAEDAEETEIVEVNFVEVSAATLEAPKTFGNTVVPLLSVIWLAGVSGMLLYMAFSYFRIWRKVQVSAREAGNVFLSDNLTSPFILGVIRPRIYLPSGIREEEKTYVLAHEQAHLKRLDHLWKPLGFLLLSVYWFNPVLWAAYILLCRDIELACDEKVIGREGEAFKKQYSEALLACSAKQRLVTACPLAFGEVGVKSRIKSVLNYKKPAFWILAGALLISLIAAGCALTNPKESTPAESSSDPSSAAESTPAETIPSESTQALPPESTAAKTDPAESSSDPGLPAESSAEPTQPESTAPAEVIQSGLFKGVSTDQEATLTLTVGDEQEKYVFDSDWLKRVIASFDGWTLGDRRTTEYEAYLNSRGTDYTLRVSKSLKIEGMWRWRWGWGVLKMSGTTYYLGKVNGTLCWLPAAFVDVMEEWCVLNTAKQYFHDGDFLAFSWNTGASLQKKASLVPQTAENLPDTLGTARGKTEDIKGEHSYYIAALDLTLELPEGYYLYRIDGLYRDEKWNPVRLEFVDEYILALRDLSEEELEEEICGQKEKKNVLDHVPDWVLWDFKIVHKDYLAVEQLYKSYVPEVGEIRQAGDYLLLSGTCPWWSSRGYYDEEGVFHNTEGHEAAFSPEYEELYTEIITPAAEPDWDAFHEALRTRFDWPLLIDDENWHQEELMETVLGACSGSGVGHYFYWRADGDHQVTNLLFAGNGKMTLYWDSFADASLLSDDWWNDYTWAVRELQNRPEKYAYPGIAIAFTDGDYPQTEETVKTKAWRDHLKEQAWQREGWYQDASEEITARAFTYAWLRAVGQDVRLKNLAIYLKQSENDAPLFLAFEMDPLKGNEMTPVFKGIDYLSLCDLEFARSYAEQYVK